MTSEGVEDEALDVSSGSLEDMTVEVMQLDRDIVGQLRE